MEGLDPKYLDGTGRIPKPSQIKALDWLYENETTHVRVVMAPTGAGKSYLAATLARKGTVIVVSDNTQLEQYQASYPDLNYLMGKALYDDPEDYREAVARLEIGDVTVTNIHAWVAYNVYTRRGQRRADVNQIIIDEFHKLEDTLIGIDSATFTSRKYPGLPITNSTAVLIPYFESILSVLEMRLKDELTDEEAAEVTTDVYNFRAICNGLKRECGEYVIDPNKRLKKVTVTRFRASESLVRLFKDVPRVVLMSATPRPSDIKMFGTNYKVYNTPSDIPPTQRQITYVSVPMKMNRHTPVESLRPYIDKILLKHKGQNGVIHVPYSRAKDLQSVYPHFIYHNSANKRQKLAEFREKGGIFVASGCAEGVDLPDDLCRFQIIPWMLKPSLGDLWVKNRLARIDGNRWYDWNVLLTFAQMCGRSTRNPHDWSSVYTFDASIGRLYRLYNRELWKWFKDALVLFTKL